MPLHRVGQICIWRPNIQRICLENLEKGMDLDMNRVKSPELYDPEWESTAKSLSLSPQKP